MRGNLGLHSKSSLADLKISTGATGLLRNSAVWEHRQDAGEQLGPFAGAASLGPDTKASVLALVPCQHGLFGSKWE